MAIGLTNCTIRPVFKTGETFVNGDKVETTDDTNTYRALYLADWSQINNVTELDHSLVGKEKITVFISGDILPYSLEPNQFVYVTKDGMTGAEYSEKKYMIYNIPLEPVKIISTWELQLVEAE